MNNTILLDTEKWDMVLDAAGNIALASPPYSTNQDVASACRVDKGEMWYDGQRGVAYSAEILGQLPPAALITRQLELAAMSVPTVTIAVCVIEEFDSRKLSGRIEYQTESGATGIVTI